MRVSFDKSLPELLLSTSTQVFKCSDIMSMFVPQGVFKDILSECSCFPWEDRIVHLATELHVLHRITEVEGDI